MVAKTDLESMLDESGFGAAAETGGFALYKGSEVSLVPEPFLTPIFNSSTSVGAAAKISISTNFVPSDPLNTNPPTLLLIRLQSLHIYFIPLLMIGSNTNKGKGEGEFNRGLICWKCGGIGCRGQVQGGGGETLMIT